MTDQFFFQQESDLRLDARMDVALEADGPAILDDHATAQTAPDHVVQPHLYAFGTTGETHLDTDATLATRHPAQDAGLLDGIGIIHIELVTADIGLVR